MNTKEYEIEIPKMDYQIITLAIKNSIGELVKLNENDKMFMTVKKSYASSEVAFQKTLTDGIKYNEQTKKYEIEIKPEDTKGLNVNSLYGFDITIYYDGNKPKQKIIGNLKIGIKYTLNEVV